MRALRFCITWRQGRVGANRIIKRVRDGRSGKVGLRAGKVAVPRRAVSSSEAGMHA